MYLWISDYITLNIFPLYLENTTGESIFPYHYTSTDLRNFA